MLRESSPGLVTNIAPASTARRAVSRSHDESAPTIRSGARRRSSPMTRSASGTVIVISTMGIPASATVSAAKRAPSADRVRIDGMMPIPSMRSRSSACFWLLATVSPLHLGHRQHVVVSRDPDVKGRQQNDAQQQGGNQAAHNDNRERPLRIGSDL